MYARSVAAKSKLAWYGVRTLFRFVATGKPKAIDGHFDPMSTLVEDRVVIFKADSFDSAIKQAEREAMDYCNRNRFVNIYGQSVRLKFLHAVDAYALPDDELSAGCEVYSSTAISPRSVSNTELVAERFGKVEGRSPNRYKFMDGGILRDALAATGAPPRHTR